MPELVSSYAYMLKPQIKLDQCPQMFFFFFFVHPISEVNSLLPGITVVEPSPITVVSVISLSRILSSSDTTISIFGLLFPGKPMHCSASLIKSFIPSAVKLPTSRRSTKVFELRRVSTCIIKFRKNENFENLMPWQK